MRWVVGDIHGCAREFEDLLEAIRFDAGRDELWSVGDLVNTGPDSLDVLRLWRDAGGRAVVGNHDIYALLVRSGRAPRRTDRLERVLAAPDADELLSRLRASPADGHRSLLRGGRRTLLDPTCRGRSRWGGWRCALSARVSW